MGTIEWWPATRETSMLCVPIAVRRPHRPPQQKGPTLPFLSNTFQALSSRDYRLYAAGQATSVTGTWMQKLAQSWLVLEMTNSGLMLGVSVACQQLPTLLFTASGGSLADRFDRRRILITTAVLAMLPALALGLVVHFQVVALWMVLSAALVQGLVDALERPTRMTFVNDIVGPRLLANAVTLNNVIQNSGKLVGPAVAGLLIGAYGIEAAFFINAVSYVAVFVGLVLIRPRFVEAHSTQQRGRVRETLRYVADRRELSTPLMLLAVIGLFGYNFQVLVPILMRDDFGGSAGSVGLGLTCMGLGGIIGGLIVAGRLKGSARTQLRTAAFFCSALLLTTLAPTIWTAFGALFVAGAASVIFQSASGTYFQLTTDRHMRGRVMALYVIALAGSSPLGGPMQGAIAEVTSARIALLVATIATTSACAIAYRSMRVGGWPVGSGSALPPLDRRQADAAGARASDAI